MARIAGVNIPNHQHAEIALTAIFGIGRTRAQKICDAAGVTRSAKAVKRRKSQNMTVSSRSTKGACTEVSLARRMASQR